LINRRLQPLYAALLSLSIWAGHVHAADENPDTVTGVRDLAYGEVLFYFFQDDYFSALTRLLAAQSRNELTHHATEAELLLGGLYLSYGQHRHAGEIFERLLEQSVDPDVHDRAWLFLAKIWYQRGYLDEAHTALARINSELDADLEPERQMLAARILMDKGRFDEALISLQLWDDPQAEWIGYAKYNIGVSLVRLSRVAEGARILDEVGRIAPSNEEGRGLRDKANLALGYAWLQADRPLEAKAPLQRVRLDGPFSSKALLGVGWSDAAVDSFDTALVPWMELQERSLFDPAVQEGLLAVPYAFSRLGADDQAADHYLDAIATFDAELQRIESSIGSIEGGRFVAALLDDETLDASGWQWRLAALPDSDETRSLYELLASHRFQEGLKNYRDLQFLRGNLERWQQSLEAFDDILDTRQRAYQQRLPLIDDSLALVDLEEMTTSAERYRARLVAVEDSRDVIALGTPAEQEQMQLLRSIGSQLEMIGDEPGADELRHKQRILNGVLLWDLEREYKVRLWRERRDLRELEAQLAEASRTYGEVQGARNEWPVEFATLTDRTAALTPRVLELTASIDETLSAQARYLEGVAVDELRGRQERLNTYRVQARFALASIYDRATARVDTPVQENISLEQLAGAGQ
jgi:tetratricopeptide (TPR) repeat protein